MLRLFENPNVVFTDVNEQTGRLTVAVHNTGAAPAVRGGLAELGVPVALVDIEVTTPVVEMQNLRDEAWPLAGGVQIVRRVNEMRLAVCTLGFNAFRQNVAGFVTNSHCTAERGTVEGTIHYHHWYPGFAVGTEIADPPFFTGGLCPKNKRCSYADVAFDRFHPSLVDRDWSLGFIKRTDSVNTGSLTIAGNFRIVGEAGGNAAMGETLNKVGRTTGWSQGPVVNTCINTGVLSTNIVMLCQDRVDANVDGGDSGSPVFQISTGNDVILYGILWGGWSGGPFVYSPIANVQRTSAPGPSLGPLTNCATGFSC